MNIVTKLAGFTLRLALGEIGEKAMQWMDRYYSDPTQALPKAIEQANTQTWRVIELALAGDSLTAWLQGKIVSGAERGVLGPLKQWVQQQGEDFRRACLDELRVARRAGWLTKIGTAQELVATGASIANPNALFDSTRTLMADLALELRSESPHLARFLADPDGQTGVLLISTFGYFLRQAVANHPRLCNELQFNLLSEVWRGQAQGWEALGQLLTQQGAALAAELERIGAEQSEIKEMLRVVLERLPESARRGSVTPRLSASLRSVADVRLLEELERRINALSSDQRTPEMLDVVGRLAMAVGVFAHAEEHFRQAASRSGAASAQAEAHYNTYRALLEQKRWDDALAALLAAGRLDPERFALFPAKYKPQRILGAGGFGVAFLCEHAHFRRLQVIKSFHAESLERGFDEIFREGELLSDLNHPAIIRVLDGGYTHEAQRQRPYLALEYFDAPTLDGYLAQQGCLTLPQVLPLARQVAEALQAAHEQNVLHRDLKPDNLLIRRGAKGDWEIKIIDFGLAVAGKVVAESAAAGNLDQSLAGESLGGTFQYSAPEQLGIIKGKIGPWSDIYAFGKTLSHALFLTPYPSRKNYRHLGDHPFADLLGDCLEQEPTARPQHFGEVLKVLGEMENVDSESSRKKAAEDAEREEQIRQESVRRAEAEKESARRKKAAEDAEREERIRQESVRRAEAEKESARKKKVAEEKAPPGIILPKEPQPGEEREFAGISFVWIPSGCFNMGSPDLEEGRSGDEGPVHEVCLDGFWMGKYPVTQGQWQKIMGNNPSYFKKGDNYPVETVSWYDAQEFIKKLNERGGGHFLLPTEAQWEYACRAGTTTPFYFGNTINTDQANYNGNYSYGNGSKGKYRESTTPVGSFPVNAFGLYDMHGNVWEWVEDCWHENYQGAPVNGSAWITGENCDRRVVRGGSWGDLPGGLRAADRLWLTVRNFNGGFRVARTFTA